jgi:hypothetical protein
MPPFKDHHTKPRRGGRSIENRIPIIHKAPEEPHFEIKPLRVKSLAGID